MARKNYLSDLMLKDYRQYIIDKVKAPLFYAVIKYCERYPNPTHENCNHFNSHFYIDLRIELLKRNKNPRLDKFFSAVTKCFICEYEHDTVYARIIDWLLKKVCEGISGRRLKLTPPDENTVYWRADREV